jgi:dimethylargininase
MTFTQTITKAPSPNYAQGITTSRLELGTPDWERACVQHAAYVATLRDLGLQVSELPGDADFPDSCFVEDPAVVIPELAIITRPGAISRRGETRAIADALRGVRELAHIEAPGTMDGGDVLLVDRHFLVGISERTNTAGAEQFAALVAAHGYTCTPVPVAAGLHLKSSVNWVGDTDLLVTAQFASRSELAAYRCLTVAADEAYSSNTLWVNDVLITPRGFPKTRLLLDGLGPDIIELETSELQKMDGGLTCLSLRF